MISKVYSMIGLATKARKLVSGDDACTIALKKQKALLIIVAEDASDNTKKKYTDMCKYREIDIKFYGNKEMLGKFTGKDIRSVIAVLDLNFKKRLIEIIDNESYFIRG